jgi:hypothetical protein
MLINSNSALHEIEAGLGFLIATVAIGLPGVIEAVKSGRKHESAPEGIDKSNQEKTR